MKVIIGVDPHKGSHTAVAVDDSEAELARVKVRTSGMWRRTRYELVPLAWTVVEGADRCWSAWPPRPLAGRGTFAMTSSWPDAVAEMAGA